MPKRSGDIKMSNLTKIFTLSWIQPNSIFGKFLFFLVCDITDGDLAQFCDFWLKKMMFSLNLPLMLVKSLEKSMSSGKKDTLLGKQRHFKVTIFYRDRLEILVNELQRAGIIRELRNVVEKGSLINNFIIFTEKRLCQTANWCSFFQFNYWFV